MVFHCDKIENLRNNNQGFGITKFAETNNINRATLNNIFKNRHEPETSTLNSILKPLGYEASITFKRILDKCIL